MPHPTIRRRPLLLTAVAAWLVAAGPALAASPPPTSAANPTLPPAFAGVPDAATVAAAFAQGSDTFEGSARQSAALSLVEGIALAIDSLLPASLNPVEGRFIGDFGAAEGAIVTRIKAGLPPDQQAYIEGTRFAAWRALIDQYRADPAFEASLLPLFSASFRAAQPALLKQDGAEPMTPPPPTAVQLAAAGSLDLSPAALLAAVTDYRLFFAWLGGYLLLFALLGPRGKKAKTAKEARS